MAAKSVFLSFWFLNIFGISKSSFASLNKTNLKFALATKEIILTVLKSSNNLDHFCLILHNGLNTMELALLVI